MNSDKSRKNKLKIEFIKSGATLLLAVILLITAVLAWFGDKTNVSFDPFFLSVSSNTDGIQLDEDTLARRVVVLPAATKLDDSSIDVSDLSKVIKIMPLEVISSSADKVNITLEPEDGLNYYIDTRYIESLNGDTSDESIDTEIKYAEIIKENFNNVNNSSAILEYDNDDISNDNQKRRMIAIVFWGDYDIHNETIRTEGKVELNVLMHFTPVDGNS